MPKTNKKSNLYTRTGDLGETSLLGGERVLKDHFQIDLYGDVDELNSHIGLLLSLITDEKSEAIKKEYDFCLDIQSNLFVAGTLMATPVLKWKNFNLKMISESDIQKLERRIDALDSSLAPLANFILPGGTRSSAETHILRTLTRKIERKIVVLKNEEGTKKYVELLLRYFNRLSDYFFALARFLNKEKGVPDILWTSGE